MFYPIEGGSVVEIPDNAFGFIFKCQLAPIGYGKNVITGQVQETDILKRSDIPEEQYWERPQLPDDYKKRREIEVTRQRVDRKYFDPYLEAIRIREWKRRLCGVWFYNYNPETKQSEVQYITGTHYLKLTYWQFKKNFFFDFRIPDRNFWYVMRYCEEDPECLGLNDIEKRKGGKCFKINTLIRMFDGSVKKVQDILDGEIVMGNDSTPRRVYGCTSGEEEMFEIIPNKGDSFTVNKSHIIHCILTSYNNKTKSKKRKELNITVEEYFKIPESTRKRITIKRNGWGNWDNKEHFIDPYFLGVWIGDGVSKTLQITNEDEEIVDYLKEFSSFHGIGYHNCGDKSKSGNKLQHILGNRERLVLEYDGVEYENKEKLMRHLGKHPKTPLKTFGLYKKGFIKIKRRERNTVWDKMKEFNLPQNKHLPKEYMIDGRENRLKLLAGIIDSDGHLANNKGSYNYKIAFSNKYPLVIEGVIELARSLGFYCGVRQEKRSNATSIHLFGELYNIPCKVKRKICPIHKKMYDSSYVGFSIKSVGKDKYYGFAVDDNHLFLLSDGTIVHNTARSGVWAYDRTSRSENHHCALQSKSDDDVADMFKKAIVRPWTMLPHFFRPTYDLMKGDDPSEVLNFFNTSRRGSTAETEQVEEALNSWIDYFPAQEHSLDGPECQTYIADEAGKTKKPISIKIRQDVVRYCSEIDGKFEDRRHLYTTTVEPEKGEGENYEFQEMTAQSNPLERDKNGRTGTGLYTYFVPSQYCMHFDKYGYPDVLSATKFLLNTRQKYQDDGDTRALSSFKRKNPMNFKEAFSGDGEFALFDPEKLNNQLDAISWNKHLTEKGNLEWKDVNGRLTEKINEIIWVPCENGRWEKIKDWWPKDANKVYENNGKFLPNNNHALRIGCDPFKYDKTKDKRRSKCSAFAYQLPDPSCADDICNDAFVLKYSFRQESTRAANEDILKMVWLCGCQVLFERNVDHWKAYFKEMNCEGFLMYLPGEKEPGVYTDGQGTTTQLICNYTEAYINEHIGKVLFKSLIRKDTGWLGFKVEDTQTFDEPMGAGITLIAVKGKRYSRKTDHRRNIEDIMPFRKTG